MSLVAAILVTIVLSVLAALLLAFYAMPVIGAIVAAAAACAVYWSQARSAGEPTVASVEGGRREPTARERRTRGAASTANRRTGQA